MDIGKVFREIHSDANGQLSWGRCASSSILVAAIFWVFYIIFKSPTHSLPALDGLTGLIVAPYTANKISGAVQSFSNNPLLPQPPPPRPPQVFPHV